MRVSVVVLGDLARSPRMANHASELAHRGVDVDLVSTSLGLPAGRLTLAAITYYDIHEAGGSNAGWTPARAAFRGVWLGWRLWRTLMAVPTPDVILVQTPPAVPTLAVAWLAARRRRAQLVVDWHNLTASLITLRTGPSHPLARAVARYERMWSRRASLGFCVSEAMRSALISMGSADPVVFRDHPSQAFSPSSSDQRTALVSRLFGGPVARLVVVPSSWSTDDDFALLHDALSRVGPMLEARHTGAGPQSTPIGVVLTGDGPCRPHWKPRFESLGGPHVHVRAEWLSAADYVGLVGSADLGVSIHRSPSRVDLPMKICDLFGGGVPVCVLDYGPVLREMVHADADGLFFHSADELAGQLCDLLDGSAAADVRLADLHRGALQARETTWQAAWQANVWPRLQQLTRR